MANVSLFLFFCNGRVNLELYIRKTGIIIYKERLNVRLSKSTRYEGGVLNELENYC